MVFITGAVRGAATTARSLCCVALALHDLVLCYGRRVAAGVCGRGSTVSRVYSMPIDLSAIFRGARPKRVSFCVMQAVPKIRRSRSFAPLYSPSISRLAPQGRVGPIALDICGSP